MVYFRKPHGFQPQFEAVSCYLENSGKILLLQRQSHKTQANKWGPPAGKIEKNETPLQAIKRELFEETGIDLPLEALKIVTKTFVVEEEYSFHWYMFKAASGNRKVTLRENEHKDYDWATPRKALEYDLALDEDACIKMVYKI